MYWYRLEFALGRNSIVGTTVRRAELPEHLLADEHHLPRDGTKNDIATTVAQGCCLGAALAQAAGTEDLRAAYGTFASEARDIRPDYRPRTVSVDGWASTHQAWLALFPMVAPLRCFLHGWLNIRREALRPTATRRSKSCQMDPSRMACDMVRLTCPYPMASLPPGGSRPGGVASDAIHLDMRRGEDRGNCCLARTSDNTKDC